MLRKILRMVATKVIKPKAEPAGPEFNKSRDLNRKPQAEKPRAPREQWVPGGREAPRSARPPRQEGEGSQEEGAPNRRRRRRRKPAGADVAEGAAPKAAPREQSVPASRKRVHTPKNISSFDGQLVFADMDIPDVIKQALSDMHFTVTTPIQAQLLPVALAGGDAAGKAQTGTGKTAAFLISIFTHCMRNPLPGERPHGHPRALILAPTRELAMQIKKDADDIGAKTGLHTVAVYGGMDFDKQQRYLEQPVDIIVATPGRLLDFVNRKVVNLKAVETLVIDEADRMLDMGFIPDVRRIVRQTPHPEHRQTLLFSATLTPDIMRMAEQWTRNSVTIEIEPDRVAAESVVQRVFITTQDEKFSLLYNLLHREKPERAIIFSNRRDQAEMLFEHLQSYGFTTALLTGAVDQKKRVRVLDDFKDGKIQLLVATDVAGRGLHVEGISHVFNYHMPMDPDDYVHRIGRTGRAGEFGTSISFACELDSFAIPDVEAFIGHALSCEHPDDELLQPVPEPNYRVQPKPRRRGPPPGRNGSRGGGGARGGPRRSGGRR